MNNHLPECDSPSLPNTCICPELRACEQRMRLEDDDYAYVAAQAEAKGRIRGWNEALEAAREAVASVNPVGHSRDWLHCTVINAIDALRGES